MLLFKFKFIFALVFFSCLFAISFLTSSHASDFRNSFFSTSECLEEEFKLVVSHRGWPLGWSENILNLQKDKCIITVEHNRLRFIDRKWIVDVCREPVHIKTGVNSVRVIRSEEKCDDGYSDAYCRELNILLDVLEGDGLIFAHGEREDLTSDHGRVYCSYLLLEKYLKDLYVFSRHLDQADIFKINKLIDKTIDPSNEKENRYLDKDEESGDLIDLPSTILSF